VSSKLDTLLNSKNDKEWRISDEEIKKYNEAEHEAMDRSLNEKLATSFKIYFL
jgi:hypothetical protein